jgi:REP element-mobilizing transposase RayT
MGHTHCTQFIHIVFVTKDLECLIHEDSKNFLYAYIAGIVTNLKGQFLARSAQANHIHLLLSLPTDCPISDFLCKLKSCTSKWYRSQNKKTSNFSWAEGYLAFTVSPKSIDRVKKYFTQEGQRHLKDKDKESLINELVSFLVMHDIAFNPQYLTGTTYTRLIYHLVWSVKNRVPSLDKSIQRILHDKIRSEAEMKGAKLYAIGNIADHLHLLVECPSKLATADLVLKLKTATTHLINSHQPQKNHFHWQEGFGVFSVGRPALEVVTDYVNNQESHHSTCSFEEEWKKMVRSPI